MIEARRTAKGAPTKICFYLLMFHSLPIKAWLDKLSDLLMPVMLGFVTAYLMMPVLHAGLKSLVYTSLERRKLPRETEEYIHVGYVDEEGFHEYIPEYRKGRKEKETTPPDAEKSPEASKRARS